MNTRYDRLASYLKGAAKRMVEALKGAEDIIAQFAIPTDILASSFANANVVMNVVRQLELQPKGANEVRLQDAGAFADEIATLCETRKSLEWRFLHSQFLVDDMHDRIVVLRNEFAEPLITLWMAYDAIRKNGAEVSELRTAWTDIDKRVRAAEQASVDNALRESSPAKRVKLTLALKPVASASPKGRSADKREGDRQLRNSLKEGGKHSDEKGKKGKNKKRA